jgi:hypothetical protein
MLQEINKRLGKNSPFTPMIRLKYQIEHFIKFAFELDLDSQT